MNPPAPKIGVSSPHASPISLSTSLAVTVIRRLRQCLRYVAAGKHSAHQYHMHGLYSIRAYMSMLARYTHIEECIGRALARMSGTSSAIQPHNHHNHQSEHDDDFNWRNDIVSMRRDLTASLKYGGLYSLPALLSYMLREGSITSTSRRTTTIDPRCSCALPRSALRDVCVTSTKWCTSNWMTVGRYHTTSSTRSTGRRRSRSRRT